MPDKRKHRGAHPSDAKLFAENQIPMLSLALADLSWLFGRGYGEKASIKLVGDRYRLKERQRKALLRIVCTEIQKINRHDKELKDEDLANQAVYIDALNVLITVESALSDAYIFRWMDGTYLDLASVHGTYRRVMETQQSIVAVGAALQELNVGECTWLIDRPVSNSAQIKSIIDEVGQTHNFNWTTELPNDPDSIMIQSSRIAISSDSLILDTGPNWYNLLHFIFTNQLTNAKILHFEGWNQ